MNSKLIEILGIFGNDIPHTTKSRWGKIDEGKWSRGIRVSVINQEFKD
jgi:hypothetical protein